MNQPISQDRRFTRVVEWLAGIGAGVLLVALGWIGSTLMDVRQAIAVLQVQTAPSAIRMDRIEAKIENMQEQASRIETKVATMEARQVRQVGQ